MSENNKKVQSENVKMEQLTADINTFKKSVDESKHKVEAHRSEVLTLVEEMARVTLIDPPPVNKAKINEDTNRLVKSGLEYQVAYHALLMLTVTLLTQMGGSATINDMDCIDLFPEINVVYPDEETAHVFTETRQEIATPFRRYSWDGMKEYE